jgi:hypothetical protein
MLTEKLKKWIAKNRQKMSCTLTLSFAMKEHLVMAFEGQIYPHLTEQATRKSCSCDVTYIDNNHSKFLLQK